MIDGIINLLPSLFLNFYWWWYYFHFIKFCDVLTLLSNHNSGARCLNRSPLLPSGLCEAKCLQAVPPTQTSPVGHTATLLMSSYELSCLPLRFSILLLSPRLTKSCLFFKDYFNFHSHNISRFNFYLFSEALVNFLSVPFILLCILLLILISMYHFLR